MAGNRPPKQTDTCVLQHAVGWGALRDYLLDRVFSSRGGVLPESMAGAAQEGSEEGVSPHVGTRSFPLLAGLEPASGPLPAPRMLWGELEKDVNLGSGAQAGFQLPLALCAGYKPRGDNVVQKTPTWGQAGLGLSV